MPVKVTLLSDEGVWISKRVDWCNVMCVWPRAEQ